MKTLTIIMILLSMLSAAVTYNITTEESVTTTTNIGYQFGFIDVFRYNGLDII